MSLSPLDLTIWRTRLQTQLQDSVRLVELSTSRRIVEDFGKVAPAVYLLRQEGVAGRPGDSASGVVQFVEATVEVLIVAQRYGDALGAKAVDALRVLRAEVWDALIGWTPTDAGLPIVLDRYTDGDPSQSVLYGIDRFRTAYQLRKL